MPLDTILLIFSTGLIVLAELNVARISAQDGPGIAQVRTYQVLAEDQADNRGRTALLGELSKLVFKNCVCCLESFIDGGDKGLSQIFRLSQKGTWFWILHLEATPCSFGCAHRRGGALSEGFDEAKVEVIAEKLGALVATMAIKNSKVADWYLRMKL